MHQSWFRWAKAHSCQRDSIRESQDSFDPRDKGLNDSPMEVGIRFPGHISYLWFPKELKKTKQNPPKPKPQNYSSCRLVDVILWPQALENTIKLLMSWKESTLASTHGLSLTGQRKDERKREQRESASLFVCWEGLFWELILTHVRAGVFSLAEQWQALSAAHKLYTF